MWKTKFFSSVASTLIFVLSDSKREDNSLWTAQQQSFPDINMLSTSSCTQIVMYPNKSDGSWVRVESVRHAVHLMGVKVKCGPLVQWRHGNPKYSEKKLPQCYYVHHKPLNCSVPELRTTITWRLAITVCRGVEVTLHESCNFCLGG
jgi:hypothetical protein